MPVETKEIGTEKINVENKKSFPKKFLDFISPTRDKIRIVLILFVFYIILANLSAIFRTGILNTIFYYPSLILALDDTTFIHYFYINPEFWTSKILPFFVSVIWWYVIAVVVVGSKNYLRNRKYRNDMKQVQVKNAG